MHLEEKLKVDNLIITIIIICKLLMLIQNINPEDTATELAGTRQHIYSSFEKVFCFLMPHPGLKVSEKKSFDGRLSG